VVVKVQKGGLDELRRAARQIAELPDVVTKVVRATVNDTVDDLHLRAQMEMQRKFDRPTPYMMRGVKKLKSGTVVGSRNQAARFGGRTQFQPGGRRRVIPGASPRRTVGEAGIYFEEFGGGTSPADVIEPHIKGGGRGQKRFEKRLSAYQIGSGGSYMVPTGNARRDQYGNPTGSLISQMLFELNTFDSAQRNPSGRKRKQRVRRATREYFIYRRSGFPIGIAERVGKRRIRLIMRFTRQPKYQTRYPFYEFSQRQATASLPRHFNRIFTRYAKRAGVL